MWRRTVVVGSFVLCLSRRGELLLLFIMGSVRPQIVLVCAFSLSLFREREFVKLCIGIIDVVLLLVLLYLCVFIYLWMIRVTKFPASDVHVLVIFFGLINLYTKKVSTNGLFHLNRNLYNETILIITNCISNV